MMARPTYNYIDELNGFINDAQDYEEDEDHDYIGPIDNRIFISAYILSDITTNQINFHKKTSISINLTPKMIKTHNNLSKRTKKR